MRLGAGAVDLGEFEAWGAEAVDLGEFEAALVYVLISRTTKAT